MPAPTLEKYEEARSIIREYEQDQLAQKAAEASRLSKKYVGKYFKYEKKDAESQTSIWYEILSLDESSGELMAIEYHYDAYLSIDRPPYVTNLSVSQDKILGTTLQNKMSYRRITQKKFLKETEFIRDHLQVLHFMETGLGVSA